MLLIYTPRLTNRLGYTLNVIFRHMLRTDFSITTDEAYFAASEGAKLCYGPRRIGDSLHIKSCNLLFATSIEEVEAKPARIDGQWTLFPVYGRDLDIQFDLLAATFFMLSRYEEYLPHRKDQHGRFTADQSLAAEAGFLTEPVVDQWICLLRKLLTERYHDIKLKPRTYRFVQTVDIDAAWCYLHKGFFRTVTGLARDAFARRDMTEVRRRIRVLRHREQDPFDTFDYILDKARNTPDSHLIFFALLADYGQYDKPSNYMNPHTRELLQHLGDYAKVGIHPGYHSLEEPMRLDAEKRRLQDIMHRTIVRARFHFLRMRLPRGYRILQRSGIRHDYTMGYADTIGFRAGTSVPYPFYDLERDLETELTIHPFCAMDTAMNTHMGLSPEQAVETYKDLTDKVRQVGGDFCCVIHNQNLCELFGWQGWRNVYEQMLELAKP